MSKEATLIPIERIENKILLIRGQKVMIDRDLAELYGVETKHLNRQVRRNIERFPKEFMFKLTKKEKDELVPICHHLADLKFSYQLPCAFTEHGVAMLASVLRSEAAIKISIYIVKAFVKLRQIISSHKALTSKLNQLEQKVKGHDGEIQLIVETIKKLIELPSEKPKKRIGFIDDE